MTNAICDHVIVKISLIFIESIGEVHYLVSAEFNL